MKHFIELCKQMLEYDITKAQEEVHTLLCKHIFNENMDKEIEEANICISYENNDIYIVNYDSNKRELTVVYSETQEVIELPLTYFNQFHLLDIARCLI